MKNQTTVVKHTPGPWKADIRLAQATVTNEAGNILADVARDPQSTTEQTYTDETIEANARLIAAAPDLLAVVESMAVWFQINGSHAGHQARLLSEARAAVAKATGGQS